jgi:hypothetical protein
MGRKRDAQARTVCEKRDRQGNVMDWAGSGDWARIFRHLLSFWSYVSNVLIRLVRVEIQPHAYIFRSHQEGVRYVLLTLLSTRSQKAPSPPRYVNITPSST